MCMNMKVAAPFTCMSTTPLKLRTGVYTHICICVCIFCIYMYVHEFETCRILRHVCQWRLWNCIGVSVCICVYMCCTLRHVCQ